MIDINIPNIVSISLMALAAIALAKVAKNAGATWIPI